MGYRINNELLLTGSISMAAGSNLTFTTPEGVSLLTIAPTGVYSIPENSNPGVASGLSSKKEFDSTNANTPIDILSKAFYIQADFDDAAVTPDVWSISGALSTTKIKLGTAGTQSAALAFGGFTGSYTNTAVTEKFDGSEWSVTGSLNYAMSDKVGCGSQNAALAFVNYFNEKFNGTFWTKTADTLSDTATATGCGTQNSALTFGGYYSTYLAVTKKFNGTAWFTVSGAALSVARSYLGGCGTQNSALAVGGSIGEATPVSTTEKFNGTTWSVTGSLNTALEGLSSTGAQNSAIAFGGAIQFDSNPSAIEKFNGNSWYTSTNLNVTRKYLGGCGAQSSTVAFCGAFETNTFLNSTEKFVGIPKQKINMNVFALPNTSIWTRLPATLNTGRSYVAGCGTPNAILCIGGYVSNTNTVERFNGNTWSYTDTLSANRFSMGACGVQNSAVSFAGHTVNLTTFTALVETYNGSVWSNGTSMATARGNMGSAGLANSALCMGGYNGTAVTGLCFKYNGTVWSGTGSLNTARHRLMGTGTSNSALSAGGNTGSVTNITEKFNGSTWSTIGVGTLNTSKYDAGSSGTLYATFLYGGFGQSTCENFNGNSWTVATSSMIENRHGTSKSGQSSGTSTLAYGGYGAPTATDRYQARSLVTATSFIIDELDRFELQDTSYEAEIGATVNIEYAICGHLNDLDHADMLELGKTIDSYWEVTASLNEAKDLVGTAGVQNAALCFGGYVMEDIFLDTTEKFNGTTWSISGSLSAVKSGVSFAGVQNAALCSSGSYEFDEYNRITEKFNGTTWASLPGNSVLLGRQQGGSAGNLNAALIFGGYILNSPFYTDTTEKFNGRIWTATGALPNVNSQLTGCGAMNSALAIGGLVSGSATSEVRKFNSSTWSVISGGNLSAAKLKLGSAGIQNSAVCFGGWSPSALSVTTEVFNGTTWSLSTDLLTIDKVIDAHGAGSNRYALSIGGNNESTSSAIVEKRTHSAPVNTINYGIAVSGKNVVAI